MTTIVKYGGELKIGDMVLVDMNLGWFAGRGQGGTFQYWTLWSVVRAKETSIRTGKPIKIWKSYISAFRPERIAKIYEIKEFGDTKYEDDEKLKERYYQAIEILKELNIIKH